MLDNEELFKKLEDQGIEKARSLQFVYTSDIPSLKFNDHVHKIATAPEVVCAHTHSLHGDVFITPPEPPTAAWITQEELNTLITDSNLPDCKLTIRDDGNMNAVPTLTGVNMNDHYTSASVIENELASLRETLSKLERRLDESDEEPMHVGIDLAGACDSSAVSTAWVSRQLKVRDDTKTDSNVAEWGNLFGTCRNLSTTVAAENRVIVSNPPYQHDHMKELEKVARLQNEAMIDQYLNMHAQTLSDEIDKIILNDLVVAHKDETVESFERAMALVS